jgi:hypothetical protein
MKKGLWYIVTALATLIIFIGARYAFMPKIVATHFHANFAIFIDGKRMDLSDKKYMEDVAGCRPDYLPMQPKERTHMHNGEDTVVHVHDDGVTWGHFFSNLGFAFGETYLVLDDEKGYFSKGGRNLKFILNGELAVNPFNQLIQSEDRLLISYGTESLEHVMQVQWPEVSETAREHNDHPDPGSCSGVISLSFLTRLKKAVWY